MRPAGRACSAARTGARPARSGPRRALAVIAACTAIGASAALAGCGPAAGTPAGGPSIVVTYSVLGAAVRELVGDAARVAVLVPNGADPHEWQPSARDIETIMKADLVVENGLGLEGGLGGALGQAQAAGVRLFVAADHVTVRHVGPGEGAGSGDSDQAVGAADPHLWMDPLTVRQAMDALAAELPAALGIDVTARTAALDASLEKVDRDVAAIVATIPPARRVLVTGHESLGYFADRYGFRLVGAIVPSVTTSAEASAADLAALVARIRASDVPAIFAETGTSPAVAEAVAAETGARVVELTTHALPADGTYASFMTTLATTIADGLRGG